ncbi:MAG: hypothetical protein LBD24_07510 [Spirochaetaceae bacterium]|nr:hypothetical protein [Spirochaetaceae bacterium]
MRFPRGRSSPTATSAPNHAVSDGNLRLFHKRHAKRPEPRAAPYRAQQRTAPEPSEAADTVLHQFETTGGHA